MTEAVNTELVELDRLPNFPITIRTLGRARRLASLSDGPSLGTAESSHPAGPGMIVEPYRSGSEDHRG